MNDKNYCAVIRDKGQWYVWNRHNIWHNAIIGYPKRLTYNGAKRKCCEAYRQGRCDAWRAISIQELLNDYKSY